MRALKSKVSITLDANIITVLKTLAEEDDRPLSQYINTILKKYLKNMEQQEDKKPGSK
ncbi:MAG: toxin-antitoxin system protein [Lachnospiraceae bacterium]|nr:toxin-antitoxin system protein [Lachnospiraceae bacterium]